MNKRVYTREELANILWPKLTAEAEKFLLSCAKETYSKMGRTQHSKVNAAIDKLLK